MSRRKRVTPEPQETDAVQVVKESRPLVEYNPTIAQLPASERPRERLSQYGAGSLSAAELLAIILRVGVKGENVLRLAQRLLAEFKGIAGVGRASFSELKRVKGIDLAKAAQLQAAFELGRRLIVAAPEDRPMVKSPADAANLLGEMSALEQEQLRVMLLDTRNRVTGVSTVYQGSVNTAVLRVSELFREAVRANSPAIIVVHNHPSGDPTPSPEDVQVTEQIVRAGKLLDIEVLDHLVIGQQRFVSLKERGLGFSP